MALRIVCDSATDLADGLAEEYGISIVPIVVMLGDRRIADSSRARAEFWEHVNQGRMPQTSQPSSGEFGRAFHEIVDAGDDVLCITITAAHSGTYNSACLAAREFGSRVTVHDSRSASRGAGFQVELAARMARDGHIVADIVPALKDLSTRTFARLQLDTLEYIRRGGRLDRILPAIDKAARVLKVKALLTMTDGELKLIGVSRSKKKGITRIIEETARLVPLERVTILHACAQDLALQMRDRLAVALKWKAEDIEVDDMGVSLASLGGPGLLLLLAVSGNAPKTLMERVRHRFDV